MSNDPYAGWAIFQVIFVAVCCIIAYAPRTKPEQREDEDARSNTDDTA